MTVRTLQLGMLACVGFIDRRIEASQPGEVRKGSLDDTSRKTVEFVTRFSLSTEIIRHQLSSWAATSISGGLRERLSLSSRSGYIGTTLSERL